MYKLPGFELPQTDNCSHCGVPTDVDELVDLYEYPLRGRNAMTCYRVVPQYESAA